jgi:hypothetical protein
MKDKKATKAPKAPKAIWKQLVHAFKVYGYSAGKAKHFARIAMSRS